MWWNWRDSYSIGIHYIMTNTSWGFYPISEERNCSPKRYFLFYVGMSLRLGHINGNTEYGLKDIPTSCARKPSCHWSSRKIIPHFTKCSNFVHKIVLTIFVRRLEFSLDRYITVVFFHAQFRFNMTGVGELTFWKYHNWPVLCVFIIYDIRVFIPARKYF